MASRRQQQYRRSKKTCHNRISLSKLNQQTAAKDTGQESRHMKPKIGMALARVGDRERPMAIAM
jgi:hypothetical protein